MPGPFTRRLIDHLSHETYAPSTIAQVIEQLNVPPEQQDDLKTDLADLVAQNRLILQGPEGRQLVMLPALPDEITGTFKKHPKGFGFVKPEGRFREGDVFIPPDRVADALSGDTVKVRVVRGMRAGEKDTTGEIVEVVSRKRKAFAGELRKQGQQWLVYPDGKELRDPVVVRDPQAKNAYEGVKVIVEITAYPEGDFLPEGVITKVLGEAGRPDVETQATIEAFNLPGEFPQACIDQARDASERFFADIEKWKAGALKFEGREDLTKEFILTIDPPDAKDYDDAISIKRTDDGGWELGVHIADVANFIPPGSALDEEGRKRGNSVYLPRLVIPMLPEVLSNGICSLQEAVPRFCKSTFHKYNNRGEIVKAGVAQTLIQSRKRLTYLEAQALIDGDFTEARKHAKTEPRYTDELVGLLREMDALAKAIRHRRRAAGMIHLELPQVVLVYDELGRVKDAEPEDNAFTHTLIEMFMVESNEVLARLFARLKVPLLRRIHPEPVPGDVDNLRNASKVAGFVVPKNPTRQDLQKLLDGTRGTPAAPAVHFAVLRTLTKAEYSPALVGHYALASEAYAHFTSPIRRYPDLTVHRALAEYLRNTENGSNPPRDDEGMKRLGEKLMRSRNCPPSEELEKIGKACSVTETNASDAEDHLRSFLVLQLLENHIGETFPALVTGATNNGVFVRLDKFLNEGMVKTADLPVGKEGRVGAWRIDQRSGALVNIASGRSFKAGDRVSVTITKVDLALRQLDLVIADSEGRDRAKAKKAYDSKGRAMGVDDDGSIKPGLGGGALNLDWDQIKHGSKSGAQARNQRSKGRDRGKTDHRRDS
jgi:ribonuclease R